LLLEGAPSAEVLRLAAEDNGFSLIISGSHGKLPMEEMFFGSVSEAVARSCKVPILLLRYEMLKEAEQTARLADYAARMFHKVLFPSDFTDSSGGAQQTLADLKKLGAEEVVTLHVVDTKRMETETQSKEVLDNCYEDADEIADDLHKRTFKVSTMCKTGDTVSEILGTADEVEATMIIMGSHGKGLIREWLDGSVSLSVLRQADRPVMVVHPAA
jgi:nucleotide-binding universal stress UspA family protein